MGDERVVVPQTFLLGGKAGKSSMAVRALPQASQPCCAPLGLRESCHLCPRLPGRSRSWELHQLSLPSHSFHSDRRYTKKPQNDQHLKGKQQDVPTELEYCLWVGKVGKVMVG